MISRDQLVTEVREMCARGDIDPSSVTVAFPAALEREHAQNARRYAQIDLEARRFEFASATLELDARHREGLVAHEVGHLISYERGEKSTEADADAAAREVLGVTIDYDTAWPGKGLQMKKNPLRDDAEYAFIKAMRDPDPSSTAVAHDVALENGLTLAKLGKHVAELASIDIHHFHWPSWPEFPRTVEQRQLQELEPTKEFGQFDFYAPGRGTSPKLAQNRMFSVTWVVVQPVDTLARAYGYMLEMEYRYNGKDASDDPNLIARHKVRFTKSLQDIKADRHNKAYSLEQAGRDAATFAWAELERMKREWNHDSKLKFRPLAITDVSGSSISIAHLVIPPELRANPGDAADLDRARGKYEEFHRYAPKKEIWKPDFKIPARMLYAGDSKWVTYRSGKVDPGTLKLPKNPVDYIHEHDAGVKTYIADPEADTDVPNKFASVTALEKLGECLGFCFTDEDGETVEAAGKAPLPELYATPDGKCLVVVQSKKKVLAMIWGGGLGVFARGIDG